MEIFLFKTSGVLFSLVHNVVSPKVLPSRRILDSRPSWPRISRVRAFTPSAFPMSVWCGRQSIHRSEVEGRPKRASNVLNMRPEGPAPTTRTSYDFFENDDVGEGSGARRGRGTGYVTVLRNPPSCDPSAIRVAGIIVDLKRPRNRARIKGTRDKICKYNTYLLLLVNTCHVGDRGRHGLVLSEASINTA